LDNPKVGLSHMESTPEFWTLTQREIQEVLRTNSWDPTKCSWKQWKCGMIAVAKTAHRIHGMTLVYSYNQLYTYIEVGCERNLTDVDELA